MKIISLIIQYGGHSSSCQSQAPSAVEHKNYTINGKLPFAIVYLSKGENNTTVYKFQNLSAIHI